MTSNLLEAGQNTLAELAFERIYSMIMSGHLPLGGVVNEVALAREFSISRGPIREAIRRLQGVKLVTREPYLKARVVSLSTRDIVEIFQLRESVEGMACRLAVSSMSDSAIDQMMKDLERTRREKGGLGANVDLFDLHITIVRNCGNSRIEYLLCEELYHLLRLYRLRSGSDPKRHDDAFEEHWQIVRAMQSRDANLAESLMRSHIARALKNLVEVDEAQEN